MLTVLSIMMFIVPALFSVVTRHLRSKDIKRPLKMTLLVLADANFNDGRIRIF